MKFDPSAILTITGHWIFPILALFSVYLLAQGHNSPGGGFAGGLLASGAFILMAMASGLDHARKMMRVRPQTLIASGLLVALASAAFGTLQSVPFFTGIWSKTLGVGTPVLFDIGVYLVVVGMTTLVVFGLKEES